MCHWTRIAALMFAMAVSGTAQAQNDSHDAWARSQFSGWRSIAFYCSPGNKVTKTFETLCNWSMKRVVDFAKDSKLDITVLPHDKDERVRARFATNTRNQLDLTLFIATTSAEKDRPTGIYVSLRATDFVSLPVDDPSGQKLARTGTVIFWERDLIGAMYDGPAVDAALQRAVENNLIAFFNDFAEGQKK